MTKCMNMECSMRRRNLREVSYCHYVITNIIYCSHAHMSVILASRHVSQLILASHCLFPLLEGSQLAQHASSDEAHGAVDSASGLLCHQGSGVLAKLRRKRWVLAMYQPQRCRTHWGRSPPHATNSVRRRDEVGVLMPCHQSSRWRLARSPFHVFLT